VPRERDDDENGRGGGSNGVGLAIAGILVAFFVIFPFILIAALYLFVTIYAIVRAFGPGAGANPVPIVMGFVMITSAFVVLIGVTIHLVGRTITPKRVRTTD
jgi:predicted membrane metal-binding protein